MNTVKFNPQYLLFILTLGILSWICVESLFGFIKRNREAREIEEEKRRTDESIDSDNNEYKDRQESFTYDKDCLDS